MRSLARLVSALVQAIVAGIYGVIAGDLPVRDLRRVLAAAVALAVLVLALRLAAFGLGDALLRVVAGLVGEA